MKRTLTGGAEVFEISEIFRNNSERNRKKIPKENDYANFNNSQDKYLTA